MDNFYMRIIVFIIFFLTLLLALLVLQKILKKRHPLKHLTNVIWKMTVKMEKVNVKTIDEVYNEVSQSLRNEGVFLKEDKGRFMSRKKVLEEMPESPKKELLKELFYLYEAKHYGKRRMTNEARVASDLLDRYAHV
ncbi:MAG: hypothetical protein JSV63_00720 [Candidatus Aenigmatarchaeota archaeon]|nr:MAG: hypothetical protein JSV63_00720 [Candidatus Aenigmarchaeota archaeon]